MCRPFPMKKTVRAQKHHSIHGSLHLPSKTATDVVPKARNRLPKPKRSHSSQMPYFAGAQISVTLHTKRALCYTPHPQKQRFWQTAREKKRVLSHPEGETIPSLSRPLLLNNHRCHLVRDGTRVAPSCATIGYPFCPFCPITRLDHKLRVPL